MTRAVLAAATAALLVLSGAPRLDAAPSLGAGIALYRRGDYARAAAAFAALAAARPSADAYLWLGASRYRLLDYAGAAAALERHVALAPRSAVGRFWLGSARLGLGRFDEAAQDLGLAATLAPDSAIAWYAHLWLRRMRLTQVRLPAGYHHLSAYLTLVRAYNPRLRADEVDAIARSVLGFAYQYRVDPRLVAALIAVESGFSPRALSPAGAMGLGQLMPATAQALRLNPWSITGNVLGTVRVLRGHLDRYGEDRLDLVLAAYNAGRGAVARYGGVPPFDETRWYVTNVLSLYHQYGLIEAAQERSP